MKFATRRGRYFEMASAFLIAHRFLLPYPLENSFMKFAKAWQPSIGIAL